MYILFPRVNFCSSNFNKEDLKQGQKKEVTSKAKKIIVEGNLNSSFVFCFKEHFNFAVFRISLQGWFIPLSFPSVKQIFDPHISDCIRKYTYVQSFRRLVKENHVWFYERHLRRYVESSLKQYCFAKWKLFRKRIWKFRPGWRWLI